jgi:hypothetical protein
MVALNVGGIMDLVRSALHDSGERNISLVLVETFGLKFGLANIRSCLGGAYNRETLVYDLGVFN